MEKSDGSILSFPLTIIHSFDTYLVSTYYLLGKVVWGTAVRGEQNRYGLCPEPSDWNVWLVEGEN